MVKIVRAFSLLLFLHNGSNASAAKAAASKDHSDAMDVRATGGCWLSIRNF
jgi:hypothetical protein